MNKKVIKTIEKIEEVSIEEAVDDFLYCYYSIDGLEDLKENLEYEITNYFEGENIEYSEEEKESFIKLTKKKIDDIKEAEIEHLLNRKSIYEWLSELINSNLEFGNVGYLLSVDEIIDLIIKNGQK